MREMNNCYWILENHPYGHILHIKYLVLIKFGFLFIHGSNAVKKLWITRKNLEIFKMCFDVSNIVVNSKILIVSGTPITVIFQKFGHNYGSRSEYLSGSKLTFQEILTVEANIVKV